MPADARLEDLAAIAAYGAHVARRLARPGHLAIERGLLARGPLPADWFLARAEESFRALESVARLTSPRDFPIPWPVTSAQTHCQKPFHLWNVTRDEWKDPIAFERGLRYVLGKAAHEHGPTREGRPGTVTGATAVARAADVERDQSHEGAWAHRRGLLSLLAQDPARTGLGKRDPREQRESS